MLSYKSAIDGCAIVESYLNYGLKEKRVSYVNPTRHLTPTSPYDRSILKKSLTTFENLIFIFNLNFIKCVYNIFLVGVGNVSYFTREKMKKYIIFILP